MKYTFKIPKTEYFGRFQVYVLTNDKTDKYASLTEDVEYEFDPDSLIIEYQNKQKLEHELNIVTTNIFKAERLLGRVTVLRDALLKEESIYQTQKYLDLDKTNAFVDDKGKRKTETNITAMLQAKSLDDPTLEKLWNYIGKAKIDAYDLESIIKALKGQLFKCKDFYANNFQSYKGS